MIVSGQQRRDSAMYIHVSILLTTALPSRLPYNIEQSSSCYTVVLVGYPGLQLFQKYLLDAIVQSVYWVLLIIPYFNTHYQVNIIILILEMRKLKPGRPGIAISPKVSQLIRAKNQLLRSQNHCALKLIPLKYILNLTSIGHIQFIFLPGSIVIFLFLKKILLFLKKINLFTLGHAMGHVDLVSQSRIQLAPPLHWKSES